MVLGIKVPLIVLRALKLNIQSLIAFYKFIKIFAKIRKKLLLFVLNVC